MLRMSPFHWNRVGKCNHYMYRGEAVFFAKFEDGAWRFGLKDLNVATGTFVILKRSLNIGSIPK
jgi:hypothetical protein